MAKFEVTGIEKKYDDMWQITFEAKLHPTYSSLLFLKLSKSQAAAYTIGSTVELDDIPRKDALQS